MYNYSFDKEVIVIESIDKLISINDLEIRGNVIVSDKNLLIFKDGLEGSILRSRGIYEMPEYELVIKIGLDEIKYAVEDKNTVIKREKDEIIIYEFELKKAENN